MKRSVKFVLAAAGLVFLLSTPTAAQQGNGIGLFAVDFCKPFITTCPAGVPPLGICVSIVSTCNDALKTGNPHLFAHCCSQCSEGAELCGIDGAICTVNFGCVP
jgi:hypothetical protein